MTGNPVSIWHHIAFMVGSVMRKAEILSGLLREVLTSQRFAVLATQSNGQPYSNLVAFAKSKDLGSLLFVTNRNTRKFSNAQSNKEVAFLIDNRTNQSSDLQNAIAITALGNIREVDKNDSNYLSQIYISKHPQLADFLNEPSNALMEVVVTGYFVATFEGSNYISMDEI